MRPAAAAFRLLPAAVYVGCASMYTQQPIQNASSLTPGMSPQQVTSIMGRPAKSEFSQGVVEWHYCRTGSSADQFLALFFQDERLISTRNYTVTLADTGGATGGCEKFVKMGNYREPDTVTEIRLRYRP